MLASDDVVCASLRFIAEESVPNLRNTIKFIGSYATAGAWIHLYSYLDKLQQKILYWDTVSVVYIQPNARSALVETGDWILAMTSELKPGHHIEEFVRGEPKKYAYRVVDPTTGNREALCRVRGIPLKYSASQLVNFNVMKDMILRGDEAEKFSVYTERKIR